MIFCFTSCNKDDSPPNARISIKESLDIGVTSVSFYVNYDYPAKLADVKIHVSSNSSMYNATVCNTDCKSDYFTANISGLNDNTTYYYCYEYVSGPSKMKSDVKSFKTKETAKMFTWYWDDGTAESGWVALSTNTNDHWMGNRFTINESVVITSIDVYGVDNSNNKDSPVFIDIYNQSRELIRSSNSFILPKDKWINVSINPISYSGTFYVMVRWPAYSSTSYLGIDTNGPYANYDIAWVRRSNGNWVLLRENNPDKPNSHGVFLIRVNGNISSTKSIIYPIEEEFVLPHENVSDINGDNCTSDGNECYYGKNRN